MTRGALFIHWQGDDPRVAEALPRAQASLKKHHPELEQATIELPAGSTLLDKSQMLDVTPFDSTLFLDADTVTLGRLDFGFAKAEQFGLACCICECPWARRFGALKERGDITEFNTGVMFFTRGADEVFEAWKRNIAIDSSLVFLRTENDPALMPLNDQAAFALAIDETGFNPWVLPKNYNFRPIWEHTVFGPIKVWHDYKPVPDRIAAWSDGQAKADAILHCGRVQ